MARGVDNALYVVMPAYNEEQNIEQVVLSWLKVLRCGSEKSRLVVADSGCNDSTHQILLELKEKYNQIEILEDCDKQHGPKVIALYKYAIKNGADYIFQTDSDGQTNPKEFRKFWEKRDDCDGIIGVRKVRGDGKGRAFVERVVCFLLRIFFGVKVVDANAPFRLMQRELLKKYIDKLPNEYALPNIILTAYFVRNKENILFEEISFAPRVAGKNSINIKKIFRIGIRSIIDFCHFRRDMMSEDEKKKRLMRWKMVGVAGFFAFIAGVLIMVSPAFPWNGGLEMTDSSVFLTIGRQMKDGMVPYADTFDHKGPLLYIINYVGVIINETKGIILFEFLAIFITLWFMFKIFRLKSDRNVWFSMMMTSMLFTPFVNLYLSDGGNLTEQYAMPFIAFSLYAFLKYFLERKLSRLWVFSVGVSFACVLMMRINMVGVWAVFSLAILVECMIEKKYRDLWGYVKWFCVGAISVVVPIISWLVVSGAFRAFIDIYLVFNVIYSGEKTDGIGFTVLFFLRDIIIVTSLCLNVWMMLYGSNSRERSLAIWYFAVFVVCIILACMSGRIYPHYGMVLVPFSAFPFAVLCSILNKGESWSGILGLITIVMVAFVYEGWLEVANRGVMALEKRIRNAEMIELVDKVCEQMDKYSDVEDRVTVYGNWDYVYLKCNRLPASRYSYQFPIGKVVPEYMEEYYDDLRTNKPKVFVVQGGYGDVGMLEFLNSNQYIEKWNDGEDGVKVFVLNPRTEENK